MTKLGFLFFSLIALNGMIHADDIRCMDQDLAGVHGLIPGIKGSVNLPMNYKSVEAVSGEDDGGDYTGKNWMRKLRKWAAY